MLTNPIKPLLFDDPIAAYAELTAGLKEGERWVQNFDYSVKEIPTLIASKPLEDIFPDSPILSPDKDLDSWEPSQGGFSICGSIASLCSFAAVPRHLPIALENAIYPQERSPFGLYLIRVVDPANPSAFKWVAIDSLMPVTETGKLPFSWIVKGGAIVQTLLLKAMATMRGGTFDAISNSQLWDIPFPGWFPHTTEAVKGFGKFKDSFDIGCLVSFTFAQQYDAAGLAITPPGVIYGHAFTLGGYFKTADGRKVVRVENPHSNSARDWAGPYDDNSPFWGEHPELADKLAESKQGGGNWWMDWDALIAMTGGGTINVRTWTGQGLGGAIAP